MLKAIDYAGGVLSYEGIELIRNIEQFDFYREKKKFFNIFPSRGSMQYYVKKVELIGQNTIHSQLSIMQVKKYLVLITLKPYNY